MHSSISLYVQYGNFLRPPRFLLHSLHVSRAATDTLLPGNAGAATDGFHWWSRTRAWTHRCRWPCNFLSPSPSLTRASILILYICVLRTISRTLNVVGGLGSVLSLLPTLVSAMATATAAVVVQVAAVVVGLAWALRYCGSVCTWRFFSRLFFARKYVETVVCLRSHAHANRSYASPNPSTACTLRGILCFPCAERVFAFTDSSMPYPCTPSPDPAAPATSV